MNIYLGGAIQGCTDAECNDWRERATEILNFKGIRAVNPMVRDYRGVQHLKYKEIVELDKLDIIQCQALLVSYLHPSAGTSMEILFAWEQHIPVYIFSDIDIRNMSPWILYHSVGVFPLMEDAIAQIGQDADDGYPWSRLTPNSDGN